MFHEGLTGTGRINPPVTDRPSSVDCATGSSCRVHVEFVGKNNCHFVARASPPLADENTAKLVLSEVEGMAVPLRV